MLSVQPGDAVTLVLEDNDALFGSVTDIEGKPIGGARVRDWGLHGGAQIEHATTTADDGSYRLPFPSADRAAWQGDSESWGWWVEVAADGFAPRVVRRMRELDPDVKAREVRLDFLLRGRRCTVASSTRPATHRSPTRASTSSRSRSGSDSGAESAAI
jgi:hypothetical protein